MILCDSSLNFYKNNQKRLRANKNIMSAIICFHYHEFQDY